MDDTNGRMESEAPSSSSSDFYLTNSPQQQSANTIAPSYVATDSAGAVNLLHSPDHDHDHDQEEDSSDDMDLSDSAPPSPDNQPNPGVQPEARARAENNAMPPPLPDVVLLGSKRKLSEEVHSSADGITQIMQQDSKKPKLSTPAPEPSLGGGLTSALVFPTRVWQQVFLDLSPIMLAKCVRVCRTFKEYLTDTKGDPITNKAEAKDLSIVRVYDSDIIWAHARKVHYPNLPRPLARLTELQMLQLIGNRNCQFCGKEPEPHPSQVTTPFNGGPGPDGVRVSWPFGVRACGPCIESNSLKDVEVLRSKFAALRSGLPHGFLTPDLHFVPESQRTQPGGIPAHLRVAKIYYRPDIRKIEQEYNDAKTLGPGAAEEWKKGLITRGKEAMADAARWEQWQQSQMLHGADLSKALREYHVSSLSNSVGETYSSSAVPNGPQPMTLMNGSHPLPHPVSFSQAISIAPSPNLPQPVYPFQNHGGAPYHGYQQTFPPAVKQTKPKTAKDVTDALYARKADIERRCMELSPPLDPAVLQYIKAFDDTMKIAQPMTDNVWETHLKPKILAERDTAELAHHVRQGQMAYLQAAVPHDPQDEPYTRPAKEVYDKEYERSQEPLRRRLGEYADDFVANHWKDFPLDKSTSPVFAVKIIEFVDRRYREEKLAGLLPPPPPDQYPPGNEEAWPYPDPFLSLDNMKWVYDNKIRALTDDHGREIFLCSTCAGAEARPKWIAFEGLIQHFGAKHTTAFSKGNIVVHWQTSEWPNELPFVRDPTYYMRQDRKSFDMKGHGRARRTPQANNGPYHAPGNGRQRSENPAFSGHQQSPQPSAGHYQSPHGYQAYQYGNAQAQPTSYGHAYSPQAMVEPNPGSVYDDQLNQLCSDILTIWESLEGIQDLMECVRIQAIIHHAVSRFVKQFGKFPNLDLVTDVLATRSEVRPIKEAHGLACKLCVAGQTDGSASHSSYYVRIHDLKLYNISSLVSHFKIVHQQQGQHRPVDWTVDMIELPENQLINGLSRAPGMDDEKLAIIAAAFPRAFTSPLPKVEHVTVQQPDNAFVKRMLDRASKKPDPPKKKKKGQHTANGTPARDVSEPLPLAGEDEYDPRRPEPLRVDDRAARSIPSATSPLGNADFRLPPGAYEALSQLRPLPQQQTLDNGAERSPSVGRDEPVVAGPANGPPNGTAPDISAILAQLMGQAQPAVQYQQPIRATYPYAQTATPPDTTSRSSSQPKHAHADQHGQKVLISPRPKASRPAYQATYRASAEPLGRHEAPDLSPAHSYNARQFEHNRTQPYGEPTQPPPAHSPPRYRPVYEEAVQYAPPAQYTQMYRPEPQVYLRAERDHTAPPAQYIQRSSEPKYIDEYGRELRLVPVDSAPAPVQYIPHPFEQQQQYARRAPPAAGGMGAYAASPSAPHYAPLPYPEPGTVYYETTAGYPPPAPPVEQRYGYDDGARGSVPRR